MILRRNASFLGWVLMAVLLGGCAHLPISQNGVWEGPIPEPVTVKEAARVERPWYGKGVAPFMITLLAGSRTGLEYNEGRNLRPTEYIRGIPLIGLLMVPYYCYEALSERTMQKVANKSGIDKNRERKYKAIIRRLVKEGRIEEAYSLHVHSPFNVANHPPDPSARMPKENLDGFKNNMKIGMIDLFVGHRVGLERNESRGLRKLEYWHPLLVTRVWEAFEAGFGRRMEDIAEKERLDEKYRHLNSKHEK